MTNIAIDLPDDVFSALKRPPHEFVEHMRLAASIHWYSRGEISMEKGALIAGLDRVDFLAALAAEKVDVFEVDIESLKQDLRHA